MKKKILFIVLLFGILKVEAQTSTFSIMGFYKEILE